MMLKAITTMMTTDFKTQLSIIQKMKYIFIHKK